MRKLTKIVATIGPACDTEEKIEELIKNGVNIFRFNFKHNSVDWHKKRINLVNKVAKRLKVTVGTLVDLQGPSIRVSLPFDKIEVKKGRLYPFGRLVLEKKLKGIASTEPTLEEYLKEDDLVLIADGFYRFKVVKQKNQVYLKALTDGIILNRKNLNVPDLDLPFSSLIDRDFEGLKLAALTEVDFVALSFVRSKKDIFVLKKEMKRYNLQAKIVAKIETKKGLRNLDEIIEFADGVMVARGDLGVEISLEAVPFWQKEIIRRSIEKGRFVITATQMLESMIKNYMPTRAEISDVANAVYDGTDCLMLSSETAIGLYPKQVVYYMAKTASLAEKNINNLFFNLFKKNKDDLAYSLTKAAFEISSILKSEDDRFLGFLVLTETGRTAIYLSRFHPSYPIFAFTPSKKVADSLTPYFGVFPFVYPLEKKGEINLVSLDKIISFLKKKNALGKGYLLVLHGDYWGKIGSTSTIRVLSV